MSRSQPFGEKSEQPRQEGDGRCEDAEIGESLTTCRPAWLDSREGWGGEEITDQLQTM